MSWSTFPSPARPSGTDRTNRTTDGDAIRRFLPRRTSLYTDRHGCFAFRPLARPRCYPPAVLCHFYSLFFPQTWVRHERRGEETRPPVPDVFTSSSVPRRYRWSKFGRASATKVSGPKKSVRRNQKKFPTKKVPNEKMSDRPSYKVTQIAALTTALPFLSTAGFPPCAEMPGCPTMHAEPAAPCCCCTSE